MSDALDYIGILPCGCVVAWCSAENKPASIAKDVGDWIRHGYDVQRVTTDEARQRLRGCIHKARPAKQQELALDAALPRAATEK